MAAVEVIRLRVCPPISLKKGFLYLACRMTHISINNLAAMFFIRVWSFPKTRRSILAVMILNLLVFLIKNA